MKPLEGKNALVTGASRGIGRGIALALAEAGASVIVNYNASSEAALETVKACEAFGVKAVAVKGNVALEAEARQLADESVKALGGIDILVNNAGINRDRSFLKMTRAMWDEVITMNLGGLFTLTQSLLPGMLARGWGRIINISSVNGQVGSFGQANYCATKGGIIAFTLSLARETARKGVTINAIAPGFTLSDMTKGMPDTVLDSIKAQIPLGRLATPEEIGHAAVYLAHPRAAYVTGTVLNVNGGIYMNAG